MLQGLRNLFDGWEFMVMSIASEGSYPVFDLAKVNDCDLFVLGGGELIRKDCLGLPTPSKLKFKNHSLAYKLYNRTFLAHLPWVKRIKIPKAVLGCGVDAETASQLNSNVVEDLSEFDFIGLRDQASVDILSSFPRLTDKVHLTYDLSFANPVKHYVGSKDYAVVIPTDREGLCTAEKSRKWLQKNLEPYDSVVFVPFGQKDNDDYKTCKQLAANCPTKSVILEPDAVFFERVIALLSGCTAAYPYRLHGFVLSFMVGATCEFYPYHRKLSRVHETVAGYSVERIVEKQREALGDLL
jgi:hypothetical protein